MTPSDTTKPALISRRARYEWAIIIILCAVAAISWSRRLTGPIDLRYDASTYYNLGTSLAEGKGYRLLNEPGEIEATQYPPLLPLLVAAHQSILGTHDVIVVGHWLRITFFSIYVALSLSVYFMLRKYLPLRYAFLGALISLLSLYTYLMSNQLAPETLFALTTTLFFLWNGTADQRFYGLPSFLLATASYALRTVGVALFAAWVGEAVLNKQFKLAILRSALSLIPIVCWQGYIHRVESSHDYKAPAYEYQRADYLFYNVSYTRNIFGLKDSFRPELGRAKLGNFVGRFLGNLKRVPGSIGEAFTVEKKCWLVPFSHRHPAEAGFVLNITLIVLGCIILAGLGLQLARRQWAIPIYVLLSVAAICLTPWPIQLVRYLTPLCPFFALAFFTSLLFLEAVSKKILSKPGNAVTSFLIASGLSLILLHQFIIFYRFTRYVDTIVYDLPDGREARLRVFGYFPLERALNAGVSWLMKRARPGEVVATYAPQWVYLRTGLKAVMPPFELNPEQAQKLLDSVPVTYLIFEDSFTKRYVSLVIHHYPNIWKEIYSDQDGAFKIYERSDGDKTSRTSDVHSRVNVASGVVSDRGA